MFTEQEIIEFKEDGLTDEEIEILTDAEALKDTINMIPDDIEGMVRDFQSKVPADFERGMKANLELIQKDPELFKRMLALDMVMSIAVGEIPQEKDDTVVTKLSDEEYKTLNENFFKTLAGLSNEDRREFLKLIENITPEQKQDMITRLTKK